MRRKEKKTKNGKWEKIKGVKEHRRIGEVREAEKEEGKINEERRRV